MRRCLALMLGCIMAATSIPVETVLAYDGLSADGGTIQLEGLETENSEGQDEELVLQELQPSDVPEEALSVMPETPDNNRGVDNSLDLSTSALEPDRNGEEESEFPPKDATSITLDVEESFSCNYYNSPKYFKFQPTDDCLYRFDYDGDFSDPDFNKYIVLELLNEDGHIISGFPDYRYYNHYMYGKMPYSVYGFEGGETYYIKAWDPYLNVDEDLNVDEPLRFYKIKVSKDESWNDLTIKFESATVINPATGSVNVVIPHDDDKWYSFTPSDTASYAFYLSNDSDGCGVTIYDKAGNCLGAAYNTGYGCAPEHLKKGSKYYLCCWGPDGAAYTLNVQKYSEYLSGHAVALTENRATTASIKAREPKYFSFTPSSTDRYSFFEGANVYAELYDSSGEPVKDENGSEIKGNNSFITPVKLVASSKYYLRVENLDVYGVPEEDAKKVVNSVTLKPERLSGYDAVDITKAKVTLETGEYTYNGKPFTPSVTVELNGKLLANGTDYSVVYSNNVNPGTAKVTVTGKGIYSGSVVVTFTIKEAKPANVPATGISLNKTEAVLLPTKKLQLEATVVPANATDRSVVWSTDKPGVADVSDSGLVTAKTIGKAVITARTANGLTATCTVKVPGLTLNGSKLVVQKGETSSAIKATLVNDSLASATTSNKKIATAKISKNTIKITGKKPGKAKITVKTKAGLKKIINVTVQKKEVTTTKLTVSKKKVTLSKKGKKATITVKATPDVLSTGEKIKVTSSNKKIATAKYDAKTGKITITAKKKGKCEVTASAGTKTVTIKVKVKK